MPADLHDATVVEHDDEVSLADRREPVRDDDRRAALEGGVEGPLHGDLRLGVEVGGGLVEHDHVGRLEQQPRDGQALLLAAGEAVTAVAHDRVEALGQLVDEELICAARKRRETRVGRARPCIQQVGADRVVEQVGVLGDHPDAVA